jgi:hypothetical protein
VLGLLDSNAFCVSFENSFRSSEIYESKLAMEDSSSLHVVSIDEYGHDEVRPGTLLIELGNSNCPIVASIPQSLEDLVLVRDLSHHLSTIHVTV